MEDLAMALLQRILSKGESIREQLNRSPSLDMII